MAFPGSEIELLDIAEEPDGTAVFKQICEEMTDEMLLACLRTIAPIAARRGLLRWYTETEQAPIQ